MSTEGVPTAAQIQKYLTAVLGPPTPLQIQKYLTAVLSPPTPLQIQKYLNAALKKVPTARGPPTPLQIQKYLTNALKEVSTIITAKLQEASAQKNDRTNEGIDAYKLYLNGRIAEFKETYIKKAEKTLEEHLKGLKNPQKTTNAQTQTQEGGGPADDPAIKRRFTEIDIEIEKLKKQLGELMKQKGILVETEAETLRRRIKELETEYELLKNGYFYNIFGEKYHTKIINKEGSENPAATYMGPLSLNAFFRNYGLDKKRAANVPWSTQYIDKVLAVFNIYFVQDENNKEMPENILKTRTSEQLDDERIILCRHLKERLRTLEIDIKLHTIPGAAKVPAELAGAAHHFSRVLEQLGAFLKNTNICAGNVGDVIRGPTAAVETLNARVATATAATATAATATGLPLIKKRSISTTTTPVTPTIVYKIIVPSFPKGFPILSNFDSLITQFSSGSGTPAAGAVGAIRIAIATGLPETTAEQLELFTSNRESLKSINKLPISELSSEQIERKKNLTIQQQKILLKMMKLARPLRAVRKAAAAKAAAVQAEAKAARESTEAARAEADAARAAADTAKAASAAEAERASIEAAKESTEAAKALTKAAEAARAAAETATPLTTDQLQDLYNALGVLILQYSDNLEIKSLTPAERKSTTETNEIFKREQSSIMDEILESL